MFRFESELQGVLQSSDKEFDDQLVSLRAALAMFYSYILKMLRSVYSDRKKANFDLKKTIQYSEGGQLQFLLVFDEKSTGQSYEFISLLIYPVTNGDTTLRVAVEDYTTKSGSPGHSYVYDNFHLDSDFENFLIERARHIYRIIKITSILKT